VSAGRQAEAQNLDRDAGRNEMPRGAPQRLAITKAAKTMAHPETSNSKPASRIERNWLQDNRLAVAAHMLTARDFCNPGDRNYLFPYGIKKL
jgi:hypothetical protein